MFFRSQDGLLVPHNLPSRNHFVKALQEAFESTLKEVRANFILASQFATNLGAAAGKQLTLVDTLHFVLNSTALTRGGGGWSGQRKTTLSLLPKSQVSTALWTSSSQVLPSLSCLTCPSPSHECHTASSVCLREYFPGPHHLVSFPSSTSS